LRVLGAAQDLHLDPSAHLVSVLFNRPLYVADEPSLRDRFALTTSVPKANYVVTRRNAAGEVQVPSAALQQDARTINIAFDKALSRNASYEIGADGIVDLIARTAFADAHIVPRIDNDRPGAILTGRVLGSDGTPIPNAGVELLANDFSQFDRTDATGRFLYEFVERDIDRRIYGNYTITAVANDKSTSRTGAVRLIGEVHNVDLVFLGRGTVRGRVLFDDGTPVHALLAVGSALQGEQRSAETDANGYYEATDVAVGPITVSATELHGNTNTAYAATVIRTAGEVVTQDLVIIKRAYNGAGTVRLTVRRSDTNAVVANAAVGVWSSGYALRDAQTNQDGLVEFNNVPAGLITLLAAEFNISRESVAAIEVDLKADQLLEQTILLPVGTNPSYGSIEGVIMRDDPTAPSDRSKDQPVPGAVIRIGLLPAVTADANGAYVYPDVPELVRPYGSRFVVFDPSTGRKGSFEIPTTLPGQQVHFSPRLSSAEPEGYATVRVRLSNATGQPVDGYRVFEPGYPPIRFQSKGDGVYELANVRVPNRFNIVAVGSSAGVYGDQSATGSVRVDFAGQVAVLNLRLPGQGSIITRLEVRQPDSACSGAPPCYAQAFGRVAIKYLVWDEPEQGFRPRTIVLDADQATQLNTFAKVPALSQVEVTTDQHPAGFAKATATVRYDGDIQNVTLRLSSLGDVTGRVFSFDRLTPVAGALVKLTNGKLVYGSQLTQPDGSFRFPAVAAALPFRIIAESTQDGIYRTGYADGRTPNGGGPVENLAVVMREQSSVEGQIVDANGNPVPLAYYWARELSFPSRSFGTQSEPLQADINGRFALQNIFAGPIRIQARSPLVQELRGDYQGEIRFEGDSSQLDVKVTLDSIAFGTLTVQVVDSLLAFQPVANAEVVLDTTSGRRLDAASTDERGIVVFENVPTGSYTVGAYSKTVGRGGRSNAFSVAADASLTQQVALEFLGKVAGVVTDPESEPVANDPAKGVAVEVQSTGGATLRETTGIDGTFSMTGIPEGNLSLFAFDFESGRRAFGPTGLFISKVVQEHNDLHLELERTATLTVKVYLPNDAGGAGELAPTVAIEVEQYEGKPGLNKKTYYLRQQQGNELTFPRMLTRYGYSIVVRELGGEQRTARLGGGFGAGVLAKTESIVFPSTGTVEVKVVDGAGQPVSDASVQIGATNLYTAADGLVTLTGVPLGAVAVQAKKDALGASASGTLASRSVPLRFNLNLGSIALVSGKVEAELGFGEPSRGTRLVMTVTSAVAPTTRLEAITDAGGNYFFPAVPVASTRLSFLFYGPDDTTIGAELTVDVPNGATAFTVPAVKLDATPPRVLSFDPPPNTTNVSPTSAVTVVFSEPIKASYLDNSHFQLVATDTNTNVNVTFQSSIRPDGTYHVKLVPPAPPAGQTYPLRSNVLYRVVVVSGIQNTTGNALHATAGSNFTTVDYTEPAVVRVDPAAGEAVPSNATFRVKFNKEVDITSLDPGYGGVVKLEKLSTRGGSPVAEIPLSRYLDPQDSTVILAAPTGVAIEEASFYRLTVSGIRDTQTPPNVQKAAKIVDFFSFDTKRPIATIVSPVATGEKLVSDVLYTANVEVVDEGTGATSTDVESVDWFDANGTFLRRVSAAPFSYSFTAPSTTTGTTYTLKVSANDLSGNTSPSVQAFIWDVVPNAAPANVAVVNTPASAYPTQKVTSVVTFSDEGVKVTVSLKLVATKLDGSPLEQILDSKQITRASTTAAWPSATFSNYALPLDLKAGTSNIVAEVKDASRTGTGQASIEILDDVLAPEIVSFTPAPETRYPFDASYTIELKVRDAQTGIKSVALSIAGVDVPVAQITHTLDSATGIHTYKHTAKVPAKNADTRIAIVAKTYDNRDNLTTSATEVIYERVDDATIPQAEWITPLDRAAMPFGISGWQATLRIRATDDSQVTSVELQSPQLAAPITLTTPKSGTTDIFEAKATFTLPADGAPFVVTAIVHDADPNHTVELPITLEPVVVDASAPSINTTSSISSVTAAPYVNKPLVVRGAGVRVTITVPLALKDLIVLDGATVSTFEETKLDLTVAEHVFVDADSKIDVSDEGFLGAHRVREDNAVRNDTDTGHVLGGMNGAASASASHAGIGGETASGFTNATYGSITSPSDFGAGGGGTSAAGNGGGVVLLRAATMVIAGGLRADGGTGAGKQFAGAGGSVALESSTLITGPSTIISASGGDDDATTTNSAGGGGGRMSIRVTDRFDATQLESRFRVHGGRNGSTDGAQYIDGGAGTLFLARPGATHGELLVSPATSTHRTRGTVIADAVAVDAITIGPRALVRLDAAQTAPITTDATALVLDASDVPQVSIVSTTPAAGSQIAQSTSIAPIFTAQSTAGITRARVVLSAQPNATVVNFASAPTAVAGTEATISVPATATAGTTTLKVVATDRAGRVVESAPVSFEIVSNTAPVIDLFQVTPNNEIYAGGTIEISARATDDIEVKSLTLTSSSGTVTSQTATTPAPQSMARQFSVALAKTTPSATNVVLTLSAADDFPNRPSTSAQHTVVVRRDEIAPVVSIAKPSANQEIQETAGGTFVVEVSATDAEAGVSSVKATLDGVQYTLQPVAGQPSLYSVAIPIPNVDGIDPVAKTITVTVNDYEPNTTTASVAFFIKPLIDPNAPKIAWVCSSPNAMYPAGYAVPLRISAEGASAQNGVQRVEFSIDGGTPIPATETATGSKVYAATFTIPGGTPDGAILNVRAAAISTSGSEATLLGAITVAAGIDITTVSEIAANDLAFENRSLIVRSGGVLTITGPHTLANVVVLDGGKLIQKHVGIAKADALNLQRLFVACNGIIDVSGLGYANNVTDPGALAPGFASGGSHIGIGGLHDIPRASAYGSVLRPMEAGGGGSRNGNGGGVVRITANTVTNDGVIRSNGGTGFEGSAGGSIWIAATNIGGAGTIEAKGGTGDRGGGGGAVAIEYSTASGTLLTNLKASGGGTQAESGGAGSIYRKAASAAFGDLVIDNSGVPPALRLTELPSFGRVRAASVQGNAIELEGTRWLSPAMAGHSVRVYDSSGAVRGTWRIASVTNHDATRTVNGAVTINAQDATVYDGYLYYAPAGVGGKNFVAARYANNRWEYDDNATFVPFTPQPDDGIFASFTKNASAITNVVKSTCTPQCGTINGISMLELSAGEVVPNATGTGTYDAAEFFLRAPIVLSKGINASITLENGSIAEAGDVLRGVYRFDSLTVTNARVVAEDLVEVTIPPNIDVTSSLVTGNLAAPNIDATKISITNGLNGPTVSGAPGAVSDPDVPIDVVTRNTARSTITAPPLWNGTPGQVLFGDRGGMSVARPANVLSQVNGASTLNAITASGFVSFSASQTDKIILAGLAPADTTQNYAEPGTNGFKLLSAGSYEVWSNGASANKNGTYTTSTVFRIEKTPSAIRWFVNGTQVHERTSAIPPSLILDLSFQSADSGEIHSIVYDTTTADNGVSRVAAAADGSFTVPAIGKAGETIAIQARDRHAFDLDSEVAVTVGSGIGVQSVTLAQSEITGGRTTTGIVTLASAAGAQGAVIALSSATSSGSALAAVPAILTIPAGQSSATFNVTTQAVTTPTDVTISATYGAVATNATLRLVRDTIAPAVTITSPVAGAQFTEGSAIALEATIVEEDSGVAQAFATIDGVSTNLTLNTAKGPNVYTATLTAPAIEGATPLSKSITVTAVDNSTNSGTANVQVVINPVVDANPPALTWSCFTSGGMYPTGDVVRLKVTATAPNATNVLQSVQFFITDPSGTTTPYATTALANNEYEFVYTIPVVADGAQFSVRALATTVSGTTAEITRTFTAVADAMKITATTTIASTNTTYENKNVVITAGTTTIAGAHTFKRLILQSGATVTHANGDKLDVQTTEGVFVACGGAIDVTGRGYAINTTYPGATTPGNGAGGSHIGYGGVLSAANGSTYGSVYRPAEAGGGGNPAGPGGGIVRITAGTFVHDGTIRANGTGGGNEAGAGGSIWITAPNISGSGTIDANGGNGAGRSGGGGAIAIESTTASSTLLSKVHAYGGTQSKIGGAGSVYVKSATSQYGNLTLDNGTATGATTDLPSLGSGVALSGTSGATLATDRASNVPAYFIGHWVRITSAAGTVKGTWRIGSISGKNVTLVANGSESIELEQGDRWQGIYRFDAVTVNNVVLVSADPIETEQQTLSGSITTSLMRATNLRITSGTTLNQPIGGTLTLDVSGELRIDTGAAIDVTGRGYAINTTYPGATTPGNGTGGSHIGYGGLFSNPYGSAYGSVYRPAEAGGGGNPAGPGGGIIRITAGTFVHDGAIRANGTGGGNEAGAGGSIWITAPNISGSGTIDANGGTGTGRSGGGGAIAIESTTVSGAVLNNTHAYGGTQGKIGGAGSVYLSGNLTIDNGGRSGESTALPALGFGIALAGTSGNTVVTDRASNIPAYFAGHWVEITGADGVLKGTWRIATINAKTITLVPNASETIDVLPADTWQGVYRFDSAYLRTTKVVSGDPWRVTNAIDKATTIFDVNDGPPVFVTALRSQIIVDASGNAVTGPAGAVTDLQTPITLTVTNTRNNATFTAAANTNGSFQVPVVGEVGDTFTIRATDSHALPLTSSPIAVNGTIVETNTITSLTIQPATITGGTTVYGSLRLAAPARSGGTSVALSSSSANASVAATIVVPSGAVTVQFAITTTSPAAHTDAVITALLGASSAPATLSITPASAALTSLVLDSASVEGGASLNGTVILGAPAPPGGALVLLTSSAPQASVPDTVFINEGNMQTSFSITTSKVAATTSLSISATWGASLSKPLDLTACSAMSIATPPASISMNSTWLNDDAPSGASGDASFDTTQAALGTKSLHFAPPASSSIRSWTFTNAAPLAVTPSDRLVFYALVNPCNPPRQILVQWSDATTTWRASFGETRIGDVNLAMTHAGSVPLGGEWRRVEVLTRTLGITANKNLTGLTISVDGGEAWIDAAGTSACSLSRASAPELLPNEVVWFDDATPAGATIGAPFTWDNSQSASGTLSDSVTGSAVVEHYFNAAPTPFTVNAEDMLVTYVLLDPCNPPREIMLQYSDDSIWRRAYWGEDLMQFGTINSVDRRRMGPLPETGRWVRLEVPVAGLSMNGMSLRGAAFSLYGGHAWFDRVAKVTRVNLALGKPATQSSLHQSNPDWVPSKTVDGNVATDNFNHTNSEAQAWWSVDLGAVQPIDTIDVWNATTCCVDRLQNFWVHVSDGPFASNDLNTTLNQAGVSSYFYMRSGGRPTTFEIGRTGRYVRVQLSGTNFLHLSEVQVWAPVSPQVVNLAAGRKATQSSTFANTASYIAALAVNGNVIGESQSHTLNELEAWWQVDLGSIQPISTIDLDNVTGSCCVARMTNVYLYVSDTPFPATNKVAETLAQSGASAYYRSTAFTSYRFDVNRTGRYVRLQLKGTNYLHPMEVRIWSPSLILGALAKATSGF